MSWKRIRGHDALARAFQRVIQRGRLAHAYLFTGPPGVGKRLFASELAKALLCEGTQGELADACDGCSACAQIDAQTHPDFFSVRRPEDSNEFPIEVMRELCANFSLKSARGKGKVAIIDDADDLNDESANCFLKTLEEPPPRSVLILIGSSSDRQLPTIVSRCQVVNFSPLPRTDVADLLKAGGVDDPTLLQRLTILADGSPGVGAALGDPALWDFRRTLVKALVAQPYDSVDLAKGWGKFVEEAGKDSALQRRRASLCMSLLLSFLEDALRVSVGSEPRIADTEDAKAVQALTQRLSTDRLLQLMERCLESDAQIDRFVQLVLVLEALADAIGQRVS